MGRVLRIVAAVLAGVAAFFVVGSIAGLAMRRLWAAYEAARGGFAFTLPMLLARLGVGALATVAGGWAAARTAPAGARAALWFGIVLLLLFLPIHVRLYTKFALWYHAAFLVSLVPLALLGGALGRKTA